MASMADGSARAARLLERLFAPLPVAIGFRLWDGRLVRAGAAAPPRCCIVVHERSTMRRLLLRRGSALAFAEAYVDGRIDVEGDFFAAMDVGQHADVLRPSLGTRLAALWEAVRP